MNTSRIYQWGSALFWAFAAGTATILLLLFAACDEGSTPSGPNPPPPPPPTPVKASDWVSAADWSKAAVVEVTMVEQAGSYTFSPSNLTFEAGKPYILRIVNPATNAEKHYFATEGLGDFYKAIATRKIETADAEYKAPYFDAVELMIGGKLDLYFVAVLPGSYDILCTIPGHKALGMFGKVTITGGAGHQLDLEIAPDFNAALTSDPRKSSSHAVWSGRVDTNVTLREQPSYAFVPTDLQLTRDRAYKIVLGSQAGNDQKHYYTAIDFYKTVVLRKAEDTQAEIKAPYFREIELMPGKRTNLFVVPTLSGRFEARCTIPGHVALGMIGAVVVN